MSEIKTPYQIVMDDDGMLLDFGSVSKSVVIIPVFARLVASLPLFFQNANHEKRVRKWDYEI